MKTKIVKKIYGFYSSWKRIFINFIRVHRMSDIIKPSNVPLSTKFGHKGLGVVINASAKIGENCFIGHNVTIGSNSGGTPRIKNNVKIFAHACIIGGITIGQYSVVGAGAVVTKDVPSYSLVVGYNQISRNKYRNKKEFNKKIR